MEVAFNAAAPSADNTERAKLRAASMELEAIFLKEMLSVSGVGEVESGRGSDSSAFATMLQAEYARLMVDQGGVGLAENIVRSLMDDGRVVSGVDHNDHEA